MSELRLHLAEEEKIVTPPDIREALNDWRAINSNDLAGKKQRWARLDMAQFENERVVNLIWGYYLSGDFQECAIQTIRYTLQPNGTVYVSRHTHS